MKWIKCSEEMPPAYQDVIIQFENESIYKAAWLPRWREWEINNDERKFCRPIYWIPLPDAPKE